MNAPWSWDDEIQANTRSLINPQWDTMSFSDLWHSLQNRNPFSEAQVTSLIKNPGVVRAVLHGRVIIVEFRDVTEPPSPVNPTIQININYWEDSANNNKVLKE